VILDCEPVTVPVDASKLERIVENLVVETKASGLASGDFTSIKEPVGGIAEIASLQRALAEMAGRVQEAQRSLHQYIGSITTAQEDERRRLARELHDDSLQALIALKQRVQLAQLEMAGLDRQGSSETSELDEVAILTEQTIVNLRRLTRDLRPIYLEELGLVPALEMLARETGEASGIPIEFHLMGVERRLEAKAELALYRIAQEALSNTARHAQASHASLIISYALETVKMEVQDNGVGFKLPVNPAEFSGRGHYGLLGVRERAELIGAQLEIKTAPGEGTHLSVTLPL
jgi:signal transduction histidine kinase